MQKYLKLIAQVVATALVAIIAAYSDGVITPSEKITISIAFISACAVFAAPNIRGAMYTKTIVAVLLAVLNAAVAYIPDGFQATELMQLAVVALGALSVYAVPNSTNEVKSAGSGPSFGAGSGIAGLILCVLFFVGCDSLIGGFKAAFNASKTIVQSLVDTHVVTQTQANSVTTDIGDGVNAASRGEQCIKTIPASVTGNPKRVEKAKCYLQVGTDLRAVLERHNLTGNDWFDRIRLIAEGAIAAFEGYYSSVVPSATGLSTIESSAGADRVAKSVDADAELDLKLKDLTRQLKALNRDLKTAQLPH